MTPTDEMQLKNDTAKIKASKNGPYIISGEILIRRQVIIADSDGTATEWQSSIKYPRQKTCSLCRCGKSKNKPFCDGTHAKTGFEGTAASPRINRFATAATTLKQKTLRRFIMSEISFFSFSHKPFSHKKCYLAVSNFLFSGAQLGVQRKRYSIN
jgi:CDGSH-type Zn-finger protein